VWQAKASSQFKLARAPRGFEACETVGVRLLTRRLTPCQSPKTPKPRLYVFTGFFLAGGEQTLFRINRYLENS
jgi:hypothetical protein